MEGSFSQSLEEFLSGALVTWVRTFEPLLEEEELSTQYLEVTSKFQDAQGQYLRLVDGVFLNRVMRLIDPNPRVEQIYRNQMNDQILRVQNFSILTRHLRSFYQEDLQQLILMPLPNVAVLGRDPLTEAAVEELRRLLLLLLGCAVQCERKEEFVEQIQRLDLETQAALAGCIQEVTQDPRNVLPLQWGELSGLGCAEMQDLFTSMAQHIQGLLAQRDSYLERIAELCQEQESLQAQTGLLPPSLARLDDASQGLSVQLADSKAKLRRLRQELEDKGEQLLDYKQEVQAMEAELKKLRQENRALESEARLARSCRDELDCLRERAARAERLQGELKGYRDRLHNLELYRAKLEEERQYSQTLQETKALLEEQLVEARSRCARVRELERENLLIRQRVMDLEGERDAERQRADELLEENMNLEVELKHSLGMPPNFQSWETESDEELGPEREPELKPLSVEVSEASTWQLLGAEQEKAELRRRLEELQGTREGCADREAAAQTELAELLQQRDTLKAELQRETDKRTKLETEHQGTLIELQTLRAETASLRDSLGSLRRPGREEEEEEADPAGGAEPLLLSQLQEARQEAERQAGLAQGLRAKLAEQGRAAREAEQRLCVLQAESSRLRRAAESLAEARGQIEALQLESAQADEELFRLRSQLELQRLQEAELGRVEAERSQLERERETLRGTVETLRAAARKGDQLELSNQGLRAECERLGRSLEAARRRGEELEAELREVGLEAEALSRARAQAALEAQRLGQEKEALRSQLDGQEREQRQREREAARLRQQLESTASALEHSHHRCGSLEAEGRRLSQELSRLQERCAQLGELEKEHRELSKASAQDRTGLAQLSEELVSEKVRSQELASQVERLTRELEKAGLSQEPRAERGGARGEILAQTTLQLSEGSSACQGHPQNASTDLATSSKLQQHEVPQNQSVLPSDPQLQYSEATTPQNDAVIVVTPCTTGGPQTHNLSDYSDHPGVPQNKKGPSQGTEAQNTTHPPETPLPTITGETKDNSTAPAPQNPEGAQREPVPNRLQSSCAETPESPADLQKMGPAPPTAPSSQEKREARSARLIEVERKNARLQAERDALAAQLEQSQRLCARLQEQADTLQRQSLALQENSAALQALNTALQVEQAALSSQHAAAVARRAESEARVAALEGECRAAAREREEVRSQWEGLRRDHERLSVLHQRQEAELEALIQRHSELKGAHRALESQHRELEGRFGQLSDRWAQLEEAESGLRAEKERLDSEVQRRADRERELDRLREENERLCALQQESTRVQSELLAQGSVLRGELSAVQLERTRLEGEVSTLREQNQNLDITAARLTSQYQLLTQLKANLEEENRHLVDQNQTLSQENRALLEKSLQSRDQHHQQQREYMDKLNELRREKQKLVEKIMDQYRVLEPTMPLPSKAKKTSWIADRMKKLIKPRGREGREPFRAQFIAAGSVENLADATETPESSAHTQDPRSAPVSPSPLRKAPSSQSMLEERRVILRSGRRKLSSRYGISESFSPGDNRATPRDRFRQRVGTILWEPAAPPSRDSLSSCSEAGEESTALAEDREATELSLGDPRVSSATEDCQSISTYQAPLTKKNSL